MSTIQIEEYEEPFTGLKKVQFSDTEEKDERFIRAYVDDIVELSEIR